MGKEATFFPNQKWIPAKAKKFRLSSHPRRGCLDNPFSLTEGVGDETVSEFYGFLFIATLSQILSRTTIKIVLRREYVFTVFDMCNVHLPFYLLSMSYKHEM